jgi:hypothetical protein
MTTEGKKKSKLMTYYFFIFISTLFFFYSYFPLYTYSFFPESSTFLQLLYAFLTYHKKMLMMSLDATTHCVISSDYLCVSYEEKKVIVSYISITKCIKEWEELFFSFVLYFVLMIFTHAFTTKWKVIKKLYTRIIVSFLT